MTNTITPPPQPGQTPDAGSPQGQTPNPQGLTPNGQPPQKTPIDSLPADIQEYIKSLRSEAKALNKEKEAEATAKKQAEDARLVEQGQFKELASKHEARVRELEPISERYQKLAEQVRASIQTETQHWPAEIKAFYPGDDAPVEQVNEWFNRSKPLIAKLQEQAKAQSPGNGPNPRPNGGTPETQQNRYYQNMRQSGKYGV